MLTKRALDGTRIRLLKNGDDITLSISDAFFDGFPTRNIIRIQGNEYEALPTDGLFTHFNLQISRHRVGELYLLANIVEPGHFDGIHEVLPLLGFDNMLYGLCVEAQEELTYEDLTQRDFEYSFPHIKNVKELEEAILRRYSKSMPHLSREEILKLGVSKTTLEILGEVKLQQKSI